MMDFKEIKGFLAEKTLFAGLSEADLEILADNACQREFETDQVVATQGATAESFFLIIEGSLLLEVPAIAGPRLEITRLNEGEIFGWSWLIPPYEWHFHARAAEPTVVLEFDGKVLLKHCDSDPAFGYPVLRRFSELMARRLDAAQRKMMDQWSPPGFA
jgi:CRP-like cAMP-binding protein